MRAIVLAAGQGRRLRPLTDWAPKALLPLGPRPMIGWALEPFGALRDVYVQVEIAANRWNVEALRAWARVNLSAPHMVFDVDAGTEGHYNDAGERPSRPVRDLLRALAMGAPPNLGSPSGQVAIVGACDNLWSKPPRRDMAELVHAAIAADGPDDLAVVGYARDYSPEDSERLGCLTVSEGRAVALQEKPGKDLAGALAANVFFCPMILLRRGIAAAEALIDGETIGEFVDGLTRAGRVHAVELHARPEDVGTLEAYRAARDRLERAAIEKGGNE